MVRPMSDDPKARARIAAFAARKAAHEEAATKVPAATAHLLAALPDPSRRVIAAYLAIRTEIDPLAAMRHLHAAGARLCVPVIEGAGLPLRFREWVPDGPLVAGPFGAKIPAAGDWLVPDTLIVPLVAFDRRLNRLGYGGGFYDRTLEGLRRDAPTRAIGFAYAAQELPNLPLEPTDQRLDGVITENGSVAPKARPQTSRRRRAPNQVAEGAPLDKSPKARP